MFFSMHCYSEVKEPDYYYGTCVSRGHDDIIVVAVMMMALYVFIHVVGLMYVRKITTTRYRSRKRAIHRCTLYHTAYAVCRWVSGVGSVYHPLVWSVCVSYCQSALLRERVWGEDEGAFLMVIYSEGSNQPTFWECVVESGGGNGEWEVCCGDAEVQVSHEYGLLCTWILPCLVCVDFACCVTV